VSARIVMATPINSDVIYSLPPVGVYRPASRGSTFGPAFGTPVRSRFPEVKSYTSMVPFYQGYHADSGMSPVSSVVSMPANAARSPTRRPASVSASPSFPPSPQASPVAKGFSPQASPVAIFEKDLAFSGAGFARLD